MADVRVEFIIMEGDGRIERSSATTSTDGVASPGGWTLGERTGINRLEARAQPSNGMAVSATVSVLGTPGTAERIERISGDAQTGNAGVALPEPVVVVARDRFGNAVAGAVLTFSASAGGAAMPSSVTTDANGRASTRWTLGAASGAQVLSVTLPAGAGLLQLGATAVGRARLILRDFPSRIEAMEVPSVVPTVLAVDAQGQPVANAGDIVATVEPGIQVSVVGGGRVRPIAGVAQFGALAVGALGQGNPWRDSTSIRIRFTLEGFDPVVSAPLTFACPVRQVPHDRFSQTVATIGRGDCVTDNRFSRTYGLAIPQPSSDDGVTLFAQVASDQQPGNGPMLTMRHPTATSGDLLSNGSPEAYSRIQARYLLGGGQWQLVHSGASIANITQRSTHVLETINEAPETPRLCDLVVTYVPFQPRVSTLGSLTTQDCAVNGDATIGYVDQFAVFLAPGTTITAIAQRTAGATPGVAMYLLPLNSLLENISNLLRVGTSTSVSGQTTATYRNPEVNGRIVLILVHSPSPSAVGQYRANFTFSR